MNAILKKLPDLDLLSLNYSFRGASNFLYVINQLNRRFVGRFSSFIINHMITFAKIFQNLSITNQLLVMKFRICQKCTQS